MSSGADHAVLMDRVYRGQRHIYDATRKYYLFGRDRLIDELAPPTGGSVLEIGCGTGRNLAAIGKRWPGAGLFGLDISRAMLETASAKLGPDAALAQGDACAFDPQRLFGMAGFDRVVMSFTLSMIPDWRAALDQACRAVAPGGSIHVVDFGDMAGLPGPVRSAMRGWLTHFHVTPRLELADAAQDRARQYGLSITSHRGRFGYYQQLTLRR